MKEKEITEFVSRLVELSIEEKEKLKDKYVNRVFRDCIEDLENEFIFIEEEFIHDDYDRTYSRKISEDEQIILKVENGMVKDVYKYQIPRVLKSDTL